MIQGIPVMCDNTVMKNEIKIELINKKDKSNMKCKLKLKYGLGGATIHNVTDYYSDNDGNYVIKQGDSEIKIKEDMIDKVVVNKLD